MKYILFIGLLMYLFLSESVANQLGFNQVALWSSSIIVFFSLVKFFQIQNKRDLNINRIEIWIILLGLLIIIIKCILFQFDQIRSTVLFFIFPMLFSIYFKNQDYKIKIGVRNILLVFFTIECLLSIYERVFFINLFPYKGIEESFIVQDIFFRSTSLLGHPLNNSLVVSLLIAFILNSSLNKVLKLGLVFLGFISLLCFNSRFAIIVWLVLLPLNFGRQMFQKKVNSSSLWLNLPFVLLFCFVIYGLINNYEIGARLFKNDVLDGSARTRIDVYDSLYYIDINTYLFGDSQQYNSIMKRLDSAGVENSFIVFIIKYGLLFFLISLVLLYQFIKSSICGFGIFQKFIIVSAFIIVGLSNNGLVNPYVWGVFAIGIYSFKPMIENNSIVKNKSKLF